ncbi:MAG: type II toxin-antitoxin system RelE/ParE family toxin [Deltaproteobacteria bacterium]|nr:type II toxin-antitoxin system RelE/ParE family toxin [Deltaproteobacteria bacterium]
MRVVFAAEAEIDLDAAVEYLALRNPVAAFQLLDDIRSLVARLSAGDFEGPMMKLTSGEMIRSWPLPPLRIYYRRSSDVLEIVRIYHQARRPIAR